MGEYGTEGFRFEDTAVRHLEESDIPSVINLYKLNYGEGYTFPQFYEDKWYKRGIYSDHIIWLVLEDEAEILASGAINLDYGDYNDQIGEIGRLVVHPQRQRHGLARRIINALLDATDDTVEFAFGEARTPHASSQALMDRAGFAVAGFLPHIHVMGGEPENYVLYANLYGNGRELRYEHPPQVIPEIAPLARHVLSSMGLPKTLSVVEDCHSYPDDMLCSMLPLDRVSLSRLARIEHGRLVEPLIFGGVSLDQGLSYISGEIPIALATLALFSGLSTTSKALMNF